MPQSGYPSVGGGSSVVHRARMRSRVGSPERGGTSETARAWASAERASDHPSGMPSSGALPRRMIWMARLGLPPRASVFGVRGASPSAEAPQPRAHARMRGSTIHWPFGRVNAPSRDGPVPTSGSRAWRSMSRMRANASDEETPRAGSSLPVTSRFPNRHSHQPGGRSWRGLGIRRARYGGRCSRPAWSTAPRSWIHSSLSSLESRTDPSAIQGSPSPSSSRFQAQVLTGSSWVGRDRAGMREEPCRSRLIQSGSGVEPKASMVPSSQGPRGALASQSALGHFPSWPPRIHA